MKFFGDIELGEYRKQKKRLTFERWVIPLAMGVVSHYVGWEMAMLVGVGGCFYVLCELLLEMKYSNLMKGKQIGLHDL